MLKLLKKYFIPHKHNDHKPYLLRWEAILVILGLTLAVEIFFLAQVFIFEPLAGVFSTILPSALTELTNASRQNDNLSALAVNPVLEQAAQLKAQDMAEKGYFAHTSPEGLTPWFWLEKAGYKYLTAGENLAINFVDSQDVEKAWMNSPSHRANIMNNQFTEIGIATAKGTYKGRETVFVAQFFGRPKIETANVVIEEPVSVLPIASEVSTPSVTPMPQISLAPAPTTASATLSGNASSSQESFALVMGETETSPKPSAAPPAPTNRISSLNRLQRVLSEPRTMANYLFLVLFTIVALALALKIFIKIKIQHPPLIINGLVALLLISFTMWLNQFLGLYQARIF